jgi:pyruvate formate lyase activating enzyme
MAHATGRIAAIEHFAIHDGPGIRVTVFLKGCPLRCSWCHSPETQAARPELLVKSDRCIACYACLPSCVPGAIVRTEVGPATRRELCDGCGECADACPTGSRSIVGRSWSVPELMREIERDRAFFDQSGGGVTFSGGEPLAQPEFLGLAIEACEAAAIPTAVQTSGYGPRRAIDVAARAGLVLFDLKIMDEARHRSQTGVSNQIILDNFAHLVARHPAVRVRVPVVPGVTDDAENLDAIGAFARRHGVDRVDLLPYHTAGAAKYPRLGRPYALRDVPGMPAAALAPARDRLTQLGLTIGIGGQP